jgi:hypothetical protein
LDQYYDKILLKNNYFTDKTEVEKIFYFIMNKKIILAYGFVIYIGILLKNNIFESEIFIHCYDKENFNSIMNDLKSFPIESFSNQVNIEQKNIGKYKGNNIVVFINQNYIPKKNFAEKIKDNLGKNNLEISKNEGPKMQQISEGLNDKKTKINEKNEDKIKLILKGYLMVIILHETEHYFRLLNKNKKVSDFTPREQEGGRLFIKYLFGVYSINHINETQANLILNIENWSDHQKIKNIFSEQIEDYEENDINEFILNHFTNSISFFKSTSRNTRFQKIYIKK